MAALTLALLILGAVILGHIWWRRTRYRRIRWQTSLRARMDQNRAKAARTPEEQAEIDRLNRLYYEEEQGP